MKIFGVRFAEKRKPSDEEQEQEQERGISVMFEDFLSKRQKNVQYKHAQYKDKSVYQTPP
jgi:U3 small nucleolar ribonucleoprotein component